MSTLRKILRIALLSLLAATILAVPLFWFISENPEKARELHIPEPVTSAALSFSKAVPILLQDMTGNSPNSAPPTENFGVSPPKPGQNVGQNVGQPPIIPGLPHSSGFIANAPGTNQPPTTNAPSTTGGNQGFGISPPSTTIQPRSSLSLPPSLLGGGANPTAQDGATLPIQQQEQVGTAMQPGQNLGTATPGTPNAATAGLGNPLGDVSPQAVPSGPLSNTANQILSQQEQPTNPPGTTVEDSVVRLSFINDLAHFLVSNYWPKGTHPAAVNSGVSLVGLKTLNIRYGSSLKGLSWGQDPGDKVSMRRGILNYVFSPSMINGLFNLYTEPFIQAMYQEAKTPKPTTGRRERVLSQAEIQEMFKFYARQMQNMAHILKAYAEHPEIGQNTTAYLNALNLYQQAQSHFIELAQAEVQMENDNFSRPGKMASQNLSVALAQANQEYRDALSDMEKAKAQALASLHSGVNIKGRNGLGFRDESLIYTLAWIHRRTTSGSADKRPAIRAAANALSRLAARLTQEAAREVSLNNARQYLQQNPEGH